jgi:hypothetical protein
LRRPGRGCFCGSRLVAANQARQATTAKPAFPAKRALLLLAFALGGFADHLLINPAEWSRLIPEASD